MKYNRVMPGAKSVYIEECIKDGFIGVDFDFPGTANWQHYEILLYRFEHYIPKSLPIKGEASNLVNYLIFSNCASFIWFSRLYNA